jgi:hypothetical protein
MTLQSAGAGSDGRPLVNLSLAPNYTTDALVCTSSRRAESIAPLKIEAKRTPSGSIAFLNLGLISTEFPGEVLDGIKVGRPLALRTFGFGPVVLC